MDTDELDSVATHLGVARAQVEDCCSVNHSSWIEDRLPLARVDVQVQSRCRATFFGNLQQLIVSDQFEYGAAVVLRQRLVQSTKVVDLVLVKPRDCRCRYVSRSSPDQFDDSHKLLRRPAGSPRSIPSSLDAGARDSEQCSTPLDQMNCFRDSAVCGVVVGSTGSAPDQRARSG